jgi:WhiB family transcriptional regulator, redox-sensing transcriptional regulator
MTGTHAPRLRTVDRAAHGRPEPGTWEQRGACRVRGVDQDLFFPDAGGTGADGKAICVLCPVRRECLEEALAVDWLAGIWGATSERERRRIRARRDAGLPDTEERPPVPVVIKTRPPRPPRAAQGLTPTQFNMLTAIGRGEVTGVPLPAQLAEDTVTWYGPHRGIPCGSNVTATVRLLIARGYAQPRDGQDGLRAVHVTAAGHLELSKAAHHAR